MANRKNKKTIKLKFDNGLWVTMDLGTLWRNGEIYRGNGVQITSTSPTLLPSEDFLLRYIQHSRLDRISSRKCIPRRHRLFIPPPRLRLRSLRQCQSMWNTSRVI